MSSDNQALREQIAQAIHRASCACEGHGDLPSWYRQAADAVLPVVQAREKALRDERADAIAVLARVVANESNHYDRYWTPTPEPLTREWLHETKAKMREALEDVFCDDAAAVMLTLIAEIERLSSLRDAVARLAGALDNEAAVQCAAAKEASGRIRLALNSQAAASEFAARRLRSLLPQEGTRP
jgi:hypothetical protein